MGDLQMLVGKISPDVDLTKPLSRLFILLPGKDEKTGSWFVSVETVGKDVGTCRQHIKIESENKK